MNKIQTTNVQNTTQGQNREKDIKIKGEKKAEGENIGKMEIRLREKLTCSAAINEELGCDCEELEEAGESGVCFTVRIYIYIYIYIYLFIYLTGNGDGAGRG